MSLNAVDEIKARCNIVDVIGSVVQLKRAGANYKGVCPFHNEKTPSFVVSESKQIFTCFGCGATGDVIAFVMKYYNLEFMEAVEKLANEYNIEIQNSSAGNSKIKDKLYEINKEAARFFFNNMTATGSPGYAYMYNRGISQDTIKKFGIGYAPDSWDSLYKYMMDKNIDPEDLVSLGLVSKSKGKYFDKFRNRVIFPIINTRGKVIGFGGRIIGEGNPKYLNSPESAVFLKKNNLYGINLSRNDISKEDCAILVEGYMDVVSLYQAGVRNVSASLGTALTENQAKMLKRYTKNVILSYDADSAGRAAALRGIDILHKEEIKAKVLHVDDGKDPDEYIKKHGKSAFLELVSKAPGFADYKIQTLLNNHDLKNGDGRIDFVKASKAMLNELGPAEQDIYIKKIASISGISEGAIRNELSESGKITVQKYSEKEHISESISKVEEHLIKILLTDISFIDHIYEIEDVFESNCGKEIFENIKDMVNESDEISITKLMDSVSSESIQVLNNITDNVVIGGNSNEVLDDIKNKWELQKLRRRYDEITGIIELAGESDNTEKIHELMEEQMDLLKKIQLIIERRRV